MENCNFEESYLDISNMIQKEFDRNVRLYGDKIKCKRGCSKCCHQIFRITALDAFMIKYFLNSISGETRSDLKFRANQYTSARSLQNENEISVSEKMLPCPALGAEGECRIYEARPVICRRFGPPVYDYKNPTKIFACDLNFGKGEEITDEEVIQKQTLIGRKWDELKTQFNIENCLPPDFSTTIAEAISDS